MSDGGFSAREVARIVGLTEGRLAYWVKTGLVTPSARRGGRGVFGFGELLAIKAAFELTERGVSLQAVRRNLSALRGALPATETGEAAPIEPAALSRLRVVSDGENLVVVGQGAVWEPLSGQVVMDFTVAALSSRAAEVRALAPPPHDLPAIEWFRRGLALDDRGDAAGAEESLLRAVERDPALAAAHNNLGVLAARAGRIGEARERFERVLELCPDHAEALLNLGLLLDQLGDLEGAVGCWSRAVAADAELADAHFALGAALIGGAGSTPHLARHHLARYLDLSPRGSHAADARDRLGAADLEERQEREHHPHRPDRRAPPPP